VAGLVYVAAFAPDEGETCGALASQFPPAPLFSEIKQIDDGFLLLTKKGVIESFAQDLTTSERELVFAVQGATQGAILGTPLKKAAWHDKPSWFVVASNDRAIAPEQEAFTAKRMNSRTLTLPTSHVPMLSQPNKVADLIIEAASSFGASKAAAQ
jgi:pimeloyl-ACP methyl ester carboxylesterase